MKFNFKLWLFRECTAEYVCRKTFGEHFVKQFVTKILGTKYYIEPPSSYTIGSLCKFVIAIL